MLEKTKRLLSKVEQGKLTLLFSLDMNSQGQHVVRIQKKYPEGNVSNVDINKILAHGYFEESWDQNRHIIYTLNEQDQQIILALKSMNPDIQSDGSLVFDIEPTVLRYLRKKNLTETEESKQLEISDQPIQPIARVEYLPGVGLNIEAGYYSDGTGRLISPEKLKRSKDGRYIRFGNRFVPLAKISEAAQKILNNRTFSVPLRDIPEIFQRDLVLIKKEFNAVLTDLAGQIRLITDQMETRVLVQKDPQGWLDFNVIYNAQGVEIPHYLLNEAVKKGDRVLQVDDTTWIEIDIKAVKKTKQKIDELNLTLAEDGCRLPVSEFQTLEEFIEAIGGKAVIDQAYQDFLSQLSGFNIDPDFHISKNIEDYLINNGLALRPYQRSGISWLEWLRKNHLHGILADDMGLGKTAQALMALRLGYEETNEKLHSIIVAPKSVLYHWEREIQRVFYFMRTYIYHGTNRDQRFFQSVLPYIFITTYDTISRDQEILARIPFYYLVLDEATRIKNPDARRTNAIKSLNAIHRIALSGTPVENRPTELWSLFDFLMRGHLGKHGTFVRVFEESIMAGDEGAARQLGKRIKPFILRRKKEEVAKDLPEKITMMEWVDLTEEQRELYGSLQDEVKTIRGALQRGESVNYTSNILPVITKLKQICDHPAVATGKMHPITGRSNKFDWVVEKIEEIVQNGEQVVVFSHFLNMLNLFESILREKEISYIRIDGSTDKRQMLIDSFNNKQASVALLSIMAAGHGINLTSANHVIHSDRWWNPAVEDQATDRVHRIGQYKTVFVYHILTVGTLEEKIDRLLNKKRCMADQIIGAATEGGYTWTRAELLELLKPLD